MAQHFVHYPIIGPKFLGMGEDQALTLWFYTFPTLELFKEWALGAPEHIALHTKLLQAMKAAAQTAAETGHPLPMSVLSSYSFHATDAPRDENDPIDDARRSRVTDRGH